MSSDLEWNQQLYVLGGWDLGICADILLQGALFAHLGSKLFVAGLALLKTLRSMHALALMWVQNVLLFSNQPLSVALWSDHWLGEISLTLEAGIALYVQMFFLYRLWVISRNLYVVLLCMILFLLALASAALWTIFMFRGDTGAASTWVGIHLGTTFIGDLIMSGSIVFSLLHYSKDVLPRGTTATMLSSPQRLTIQALPFLSLYPPSPLIHIVHLPPPARRPRRPLRLRQPRLPAARQPHGGANPSTMVTIVANMALPKLDTPRRTQVARSEFWDNDALRAVAFGSGGGVNAVEDTEHPDSEEKAPYVEEEEELSNSRSTGIGTTIFHER
ncbi:hypothetical protein C8J57DRAFT_1490055 [Mycena rebaudengoi]|nr:hypothetical protein C8J57DRAFT_1490055 [Mycena rebaudengoi]